MKLSNLRFCVEDAKELKGDRSYTEIAKAAGWGKEGRARACRALSNNKNDKGGGVSIKGLKELSKGLNKTPTKVLPKLPE